MSIADLARQVQNLPSQLLADLVIGVPLTMFVLLVLLTAAGWHGRRRRWH